MNEFAMSFAPTAGVTDFLEQIDNGNVYKMMLISIPDCCLTGIYQRRMSSENRQKGTATKDVFPGKTSVLSDFSVDCEHVERE